MDGDWVVHSQIVGIMVALEVAFKDSEENGNSFWSKIIQKQQQRVKSLYDGHVVRSLSSGIIISSSECPSVEWTNPNHRTNQAIGQEA